MLPFENLSDDKANAYFAEGIEDEILTRPAKIGALKVISRTSSQHYKSSPDNLSAIAKQLGVAKIWKGARRKPPMPCISTCSSSAPRPMIISGRRVTTASWTIISGVEGEVAGAIAEALNAKLSGNEQKALAVKPINNPAAYDVYLRGVALQGRADALEINILNSIKAFEEAVRLDPEFALAWAQLSRQHSFAFSVSAAGGG